MRSGTVTLALALFALSCGGDRATSMSMGLPMAPTSSIAAAEAAPLGATLGEAPSGPAANGPNGTTRSNAASEFPSSGSEWSTNVVAFPPRDQSFAFRRALDTKYQIDLRRNATQSFVDIEGSVIWIVEYVYYRVHGCPHAEAIARVYRQIDGLGVQPVCSTIDNPFPGREEPFAFRQDLERKYQIDLRRSVSPTFVDIEGDVIWIMEFVRYWVSGCSAAVAQQKVFDQIDGRGVQPTCDPAPVCSMAVSSSSSSFPASGGSGGFNVIAPAGCQWSTSTNASWITITGGQGGTGNGAVAFALSSNSGSERSGDIVVGIAGGPSARHVVSQAGATAPPTPPVAVIDAPSTCNVETPCPFSGTRSTGTITSYEWEFGDDQSDTGPAPSHVYARTFVSTPNSQRTATVRLTVRGPGGSSSATTSVTVRRGNTLTTR